MSLTKVAIGLSPFSRAIEGVGPSTKKFLEVVEKYTPKAKKVNDTIANRYYHFVRAYKTRAATANLNIPVGKYRELFEKSLEQKNKLRKAFERDVAPYKKLTSKMDKSVHQAVKKPPVLINFK